VLPILIFSLQIKMETNNVQNQTLIRFCKVLVRNYHYSPRNNPEERSSKLFRSGNLKSCKGFQLLVYFNCSWFKFLCRSVVRTCVKFPTFTTDLYSRDSSYCGPFSCILAMILNTSSLNLICIYVQTNHLNTNYKGFLFLHKINAIFLGL